MRVIDKIFYIPLITIALSVTLFPSSRSDVKIIESTENIRYLGQKISKDYLYLYYNPKKIELKEELSKDIEMLELSIEDIGMSTINADSKNILDFLTYNKNEIKELLAKPVNRETGILILDYSESFLEGANSIASVHIYAYSDEEKMLMAMKELEYLLERVSKYYIASNLNLDKVNNFEHMIDAILKIDKIMKEIDRYNYPVKLEEESRDMQHIWKTHRDFLYKSDKIFLPTLLESSSRNLDKIIQDISLYHKKNQ
jgi:ribosomal protein S24E